MPGTQLTQRLNLSEPFKLIQLRQQQSRKQTLELTVTTVRSRRTYYSIAFAPFFASGERRKAAQLKKTKQDVGIFMCLL